MGRLMVVRCWDRGKREGLGWGGWRMVKYRECDTWPEGAQRQPSISSSARASASTSTARPRAPTTASAGPGLGWAGQGPQGAMGVRWGPPRARRWPSQWKKPLDGTSPVPAGGAGGAGGAVRSAVGHGQRTRTYGLWSVQVPAREGGRRSGGNARRAGSFT